MFIPQKQDFTCSPVAIYNALQSFAKKEILKFDEILKMCNTTYQGTSIDSFEKILEELFFFKKEEYPNPIVLKKRLEFKYKAIILTHAELDENSYEIQNSLLLGVFGDYVMGYNVIPYNEDLYLLDSKEYTRLFRSTLGWASPIAYYLKGLK